MIERILYRISPPKDAADVPFVRLRIERKGLATITAGFPLDRYVEDTLQEELEFTGAPGYGRGLTREDMIQAIECAGIDEYIWRCAVHIAEWVKRRDECRRYYGKISSNRWKEARRVS